MLSECRFSHGGSCIGFIAYSDVTPKITLQEVIRMPLAGQMETYSVTPADTAQWVAVIETKDGKEGRYRFWWREGSDFAELLSTGGRVEVIMRSVDRMRRRKTRIAA